MYPGDETMTLYRPILNRVLRENFTEKLAFEQDLKETREYVIQISREIAFSGIGKGKCSSHKREISV